MSERKKICRKRPGAENLYAVDTDTGEVRFVAELCGEGGREGGKSGTVADELPGQIPKSPRRPNPTNRFGETGTGAVSKAAIVRRGERSQGKKRATLNSRDAQTTPDGRYLVFSTYARLASEEPKWKRKKK